MRFTLFLLSVCGAAQYASGSSCDDADASSLLQARSAVRKSSIAVTKKSDPPPQDQVTVHIGRSRRRNRRCVNVVQPVTCAANAGDLEHRLNRRRASDTFEITTDGHQVCARRTDEDGGWGMRLEIGCTLVQTSVEHVEVNIGRSRWRSRKCVTAPVPVDCDSSAGDIGHRLNPAPQSDSFHIRARGREVCAERTDRRRGWGMRLRITCRAIPPPRTALDEQFCQHYYSLGDGNCEALRGAVRSEIRAGTPTLELGDPFAKPLLVFFHGWPDTHALWANQFAAFCGDDGEFACVAPSMMDFNPDVPPADPADLSWPLQADRLFEAVKEIGLENGDDFTLVLHDFGSIIGSMFVARYPQFVSRVVALDVANDFNRSYAPMESRINELDGFQQTAISAFRNGDDAELDAFWDGPLEALEGTPFEGVPLRATPLAPPCLTCRVAPGASIGVGSRTGWMQNQWASEDPAWTSFFDTPYSEFEFAYTPTWPDHTPQLFLYGSEQFHEPQHLTWLDSRGDGSGHQKIGSEHWFFARGPNVVETNEAMAEFFEATR